jgi:hypothetical protein
MLKNQMKQVNKLLIMSTLHLSTEFTKKLILQPESGMGYQIVMVTLQDGRILPDRRVLNSEFLVLKEGESLDPTTIRDVSTT